MSHVSLNEILTFVIKTLLLVSPKFKLELNENPQQLFYFFSKPNRRSLFNCRNSLSSPDLSLAMHPNFLLTHFVDSNRFELLLMPLPAKPMLPVLPMPPASLGRSRRVSGPKSKLPPVKFVFNRRMDGQIKRLVN